MPFQDRSVLWGAVCVALVTALGCKKDSDRFPPPQPFMTGGPGGIAAGGGGNGAGGASGGTSASGGSGGSGGATATPPNPCECAYSSLVNTACGTCVNDSANSACSDAALTCDADPDCKALKDCPQDCNAAADQALCIQKCLLPLTNHDYTVYADCICNACAASCGTDEPLACE